MGFAAVRNNLISQINTAFGAGRIAATLAQVSPLGPRDDVFAILQKLGFLGFIPGTVAQYRGSVGIPRLNQRILTAAFRTSLLNRPNPIPLHIDIVGRRREAVSVDVTPELISIVLTRPR